VKNRSRRIHRNHGSVEKNALCRIEQLLRKSGRKPNKFELVVTHQGFSVTVPAHGSSPFPSSKFGGFWSAQIGVPGLSAPTSFQVNVSIV
jgi:hypothetical protein